MWSYHAYRWPSEAAWTTALVSAGWAGGTPPDVELLASGTLYSPTLEENTPGEALPGWHVAAAFRASAMPPVAWASMEIEAPAGMPVLGQRAPAPLSITPLQARRALRAVGLLPAVSAFVASQPEEVQEAWEYCVEVRRDDPIITAAASALGMTSAQIDDLFRAGAAA